MLLVPRPAAMTAALPSSFLVALAAAACSAAAASSASLVWPLSTCCTASMPPAFRKPACRSLLALLPFPLPLLLLPPSTTAAARSTRTNARGLPVHGPMHRASVAAALARCSTARTSAGPSPPLASSRVAATSLAAFAMPSTSAPSSACSRARAAAAAG